MVAVEVGVCPWNMNVDVPEKDREEWWFISLQYLPWPHRNVDDVVHKMDGETVGQSGEGGW